MEAGNLETSLDTECTTILSSLQDNVTNLIAKLKAPDAESNKIQLHAIHQSIQQLESKSVAVPVELRNLKTSLISSCNEIEKAENSLKQIAAILRKITTQIEATTAFPHSSRRNSHKEDLAHSKPLRVRLSTGLDVSVHTWREVLEKVCEYLIACYPQKLENLESLGTRRGSVFSHSEHTFKYHLKLSNGLYIDARRSAHSVVAVIRKLLVACGESPDSLEVEVDR